MEYLIFSFWFTVIHTVAYTTAGVLALKISKRIYKGNERVLDFLRDMSDTNDSGHVAKWFIPIQILRGLLMSIVLYPILGMLGDISFTLRLIFLSGIMLIYTDLASAVPSPHNMEGLVYMKESYLKKELFTKLSLETIMYSLLFGFFAAWLLF